MEGQARRIEVGMYADKLADDLEGYRTLATQLGASHTAVVTVDEIPVDERVTLKCRIPQCFGYGTCVHCPPHTLTPAELRDLLGRYAWAVFFALDVPPEVIVRDKLTVVERVDAYQRVFALVNEIESRAFYDGHYLAFGLAAGSCRHTFCGQLEDCRALGGDRCRFSLRARPSMEAVGIDVYQMVARQGWDIYPIGSDMMPGGIPQGTLAGIVIVQ